VILTKDNSGVISVNGAAAHKAQVGDLLIIASYASYNEAEVKNYTPTLCYVDAHDNANKTTKMIFKMLTIFKSIDNGTQVAGWQQAFSHNSNNLI
jgi:aspartate 1-decarboxylase